MNIDWIGIILYIGFGLISTNLIPIIFIPAKNNINKWMLLFQSVGSSLILANTIIQNYNIIYIVYSGVLCFTCIIALIQVIIHKNKRNTVWIPPNPPPMNPLYYERP